MSFIDWSTVRGHLQIWTLDCLLWVLTSWRIYILHLHLSWQRTLWAGSFCFVTCFCVRCCSCDHTKTAKEEFFWWASWQLLKLLSVRMMKSAASQNLKSYLGSSFLLHFNPQNTLSLINPYSHMLLFNPQCFLTWESHPHTQMDTWGWTWASVSDTGWLQKPGIQSLPSISPEPQLPTGQVSGLTKQRQMNMWKSCP